MWQKKQIIYIYLFSLYNFILTSYVTIPFEIFKENEPIQYSSIEDYFTYNSNLKYYGEISIGESSTPIPILLTFDDFGFYYISKGTEMGKINNIYDPLSSYSFKYNSHQVVYYRNFGKTYNANDTFFFNEDKLKCRDIKFLFCGEDHLKQNSYMIIGLRLIGDIIRDKDLNLVKQLRQNKYTETYDWSLHFDENNKNKGILLIGAEAHKYNPSKFNQNYILNSVTLSKDAIDEWSLYFDKIYFLNKKKEEIQITDYLRFTLTHDSNLIIGASSYEKLIKQYFFDELIGKGKCQIEKSKVEARVYTCINNDNIKSELKEKFPPLKIENKAFMKTFELTYDDLFLEKNDKIYFLVYFSYYMPFSWKVGLPFIKKYFFNYNYDTHLISYYNNDLANYKEEEENSTSMSAGKIVLIVFLSIFISLFGFYIGRKYILMRRKEKIRAEELETELSKQISEVNETTEYQPPKEEKNVSKYFLI
jgi:hypothetical protein